MKKPDDDDWGFGPIIITDASIEASLKQYNAPIATHDCDKTCKGLAGASQHDYEEIWDDFILSQRQRELAFMEVVRSRGRYEKELTLLRRYISTVDGSFVLALSTSTSLTRECLGDVHFDTKDEMESYYNYCIGVFRFTEVKPIVPEDEGNGFFDDCDSLSWGFDSDGEDEDDSTWDTGDDDDDNDWL